MNTQTCESCGREFACGADEEHCWCNAITLSRDQLAILREHFERCLCPDCLRVDDGAPAYRDPVQATYNRRRRRSGR